MDPATSGIRERRFAPDNMGCADLACEASLRALESARIFYGRYRLYRLATLSPDYHFPGSGVLLGRKLGLPGVPAIDIRAQCSGFIYSLSVADSFIRAGQFARVLVVGSEKHSMALDFTDRGRDVAVLFGTAPGRLCLALPRTKAGFCPHICTPMGSTRKLCGSSVPGPHTCLGFRRKWWTWAECFPGWRAATCSSTH